jgi:cell division protein FtsI/penicillin-binding protein 2
VTLYSVPPVNGTDLALTLDLKTQQAAEAALAVAGKPSALVAIRASTGEVLAVANGPAPAAGYNRALIGRYPPGSTFKVATGFALLAAGVTPGTPVDCPANITVDGRTFQNAEGEVLGATPFHRDFAASCNTAFIGAAARLSQGQLHDAAMALGYGRANQLGVDAYLGSVPSAAGKVEHAADAIGQGQVLASPLAVASVSASVAAGHYSPPRLVLPAGAGPEGAASPTGAASATAPATGSAAASASASAASGNAPAAGSASAPGNAPSDGSAAASGTVSPSVTSLPEAPVVALRALMAEVVTSGTGTALAAVPGEPVHGKTGTAEFGSGTPPQTHAWFTGYQGDVAFAVVVEGGGFGGKVAAPLAADFLRRLV